MTLVHWTVPWRETYRYYGDHSLSESWARWRRTVWCWPLTLFSRCLDIMERFLTWWLLTRDCFRADHLLEDHLEKLASDPKWPNMTPWNGYWIVWQCYGMGDGWLKLELTQILWVQEMCIIKHFSWSIPCSCVEARASYPLVTCFQCTREKWWRPDWFSWCNGWIGRLMSKKAVCHCLTTCTSRP